MASTDWATPPIAKAAVDGDMPDSGSIISPQEATKLWLKWLKRLENSKET